MLQCLGHQVLVASSGTEALKILQGDSTIDLVITDHAMPHMTGSELADQIRGIRNLPIIIATGYTELPGPENPDCPALQTVLPRGFDLSWTQNVKPPS